jgi:hypothetical protein
MRYNLCQKSDSRWTRHYNYYGTVKRGKNRQYKARQNTNHHKWHTRRPRKNEVSLGRITTRMKYHCVQPNWTEVKLTHTLDQCFPTRVPWNCRVPQYIVRGSARNQRKKPWCHNDPLLPPTESSCFKNYSGGFKTSPWCSCEDGQFYKAAPS